MTVTRRDLAKAVRLATSFYGRNPGLLLAAVLPRGRQAIQDACDAEAAYHEAADREVRRLMDRPPDGMTRAEACRVVFRMWAYGEAMRR